MFCLKPVRAEKYKASAETPETAVLQMALEVLDPKGESIHMLPEITTNLKIKLLKLTLT